MQFANVAEYKFTEKEVEASAVFIKTMEDFCQHHDCDKCPLDIPYPESFCPLEALMSRMEYIDMITPINAEAPTTLQDFTF